MAATFETRLSFLEESRQSHLNITALAMREGVRMDTILALMVLKRSLALVYGFVSLMRSRNFISAVPLIRMQVDNLLRFRAAFIVRDINLFVASVIEGSEVRSLRDATGRKMTDAHLQRSFRADYPWLRDLYVATSAYVHLSDAHFANVIRKKPGGDRGEVEVYIGADDQMVSQEDYLNATESMIQVTYELVSYLASWVQPTSQIVG